MRKALLTLALMCASLAGLADSNFISGRVANYYDIRFPVTNAMLVYTNQFVCTTNFTDSSGNYLMGVPANGIGVLSVSYGSYVFTPTNIVYTNTQNFFLQNFYWLPVSMPVSGQVVNYYRQYLGVSNVPVAYAGGMTSAATLTDSSGFYTLFVQPGDTGIVAASGTSMSAISPLSGYTLTNVATGLSNVNFYWIPPLYPVSGRVINYANKNSGVANVPMKYSDGLILYTDAYGYYTRYLERGYTVSVKPQSPPLVFHPLSLGYTNVSKYTSGQDFYWIPPGYSYAGPAAFLTNRLTNAASFYTLARADQCLLFTNKMVTPSSSNLQTEVALLDATFATLASNVVFALSYVQGIDPPALWHNTPSTFWGDYILWADAWADDTAAFTNLTATSVASPGWTIGSLSNTRPVSVYCYANVTNQVISVPAPAEDGMWAVAPAFTVASPGVYTIDCAVSGATLFGGITNRFGTYLTVGYPAGATYTIATSPIVPVPSSQSLLYPMSVRAIIYLDSGMQVVPYLFTTNELTSSMFIHVRTIETIRMQSTMLPASTIWE